MDCPKCTGSLTPLTIRDTINLHRCTACYGLWITPANLAALKDEWMSEALVDVGSPSIGRKLDRLDTVHCPLGHGLMVHRADEDQPHVGFEECPVCNGIYLDAGELTDLKFKTLLDWIKGLLRDRLN